MQRKYVYRRPKVTQVVKRYLFCAKQKASEFIKNSIKIVRIARYEYQFSIMLGVHTEFLLTKSFKSSELLFYEQFYYLPSFQSLSAVSYMQQQQKKLLHGNDGVNKFSLLYHTDP